jgi:pimeloyl-ACP methyl ester carboxylesterase
VCSDGSGSAASLVHVRFVRPTQISPSALHSIQNIRFADRYLRGPTRLQLLRKRPAAWTQLRDQLGAIPSTALSRTIRGVMLARPSVYELEAQLRSLTLPTFILIGDEDGPVLRPAGFLHACLSSSQLVVIRKTGHTLNLEEPAEFNDAIQKFLPSGRYWAPR